MNITTFTPGQRFIEDKKWFDLQKTNLNYDRVDDTVSTGVEALALFPTCGGVAAMMKRS